MKRFLDLTVAGLLLVILSPLMLLLGVLVGIKFGFPIFFRQVRPGKNGRPFQMIKFRTMSNEKDKMGHLLPDAERITTFGKFLRSFSFDELPELWNVLVGDMSLVGPRPLLMEYLPLYSPFQYRRHDVRPGITGWAQVNGRNAVSWDEKFKLDVWYVDNQSLLLDLKILAKTFRVVASGVGVNQTGSATARNFDGNEAE